MNPIWSFSFFFSAEFKIQAGFHELGHHQQGKGWKAIHSDLCGRRDIEKKAKPLLGEPGSNDDGHEDSIPASALKRKDENKEEGQQRPEKRGGTCKQLGVGGRGGNGPLSCLNMQT